jgi:hypothetical protein
VGGSELPNLHNLHEQSPPFKREQFSLILFPSD